MKNNYISSKKYISSQISFGFFTRQGGFSSKKFSSLNCSYNNEDKKFFIKKNIIKAQKELYLDKRKIKYKRRSKGQEQGIKYMWKVKNKNKINSKIHIKVKVGMGIEITVKQKHKIAF